MLQIKKETPNSIYGNTIANNGIIANFVRLWKTRLFDWMA